MAIEELRECPKERRPQAGSDVDPWTHEALAIDVAGSIRSGRVIEVLSQLMIVRGAPRVVRSDNGPEFVSRAVLGWLTRAGVRTAFIAPGKPWQSATHESFNGQFRDECLNLNWLRHCTEARVHIEQWRREHNEVRPHSSIAYLTPAAFRRPNQQTLNPGRAEAVLH
jgi:putative transposase